MNIDETAERYGMKQFPKESREAFERRVESLIEHRRKNEGVSPWRKNKEGGTKP